MAQDSKRIRHTVVFKLKHNAHTNEAKDFVVAAKKLAVIHGVDKFEFLKQLSPKNKFEYGISMEFANHQCYHAYSNHPDHVAFVQSWWLKEVEDFLEIDYQLED
jgi:hypothetical protein